MKYITSGLLISAVACSGNDLLYAETRSDPSETAPKLDVTIEEPVYSQPLEEEASARFLADDGGLYTQT